MSIDRPVERNSLSRIVGRKRLQISVATKCVYREFDGTGVLVPISGNLAKTADTFALNPLGSQIWAMLGEEETAALDKIVDALTAKQAVARERLYEDVYSFILELAEFGIVTVAGAGDAR